MLTPEELQKQKFPRRMGGYSAKAVDAFMEQIQEDYDRLWREKKAAEDRAAILTDAVKQYKCMEESLEQKAAELTKEGEIRGNQLYQEAENKAKELLEKAAEDINLMNYQYEQMKRSVDVYRAKVVSLLRAQLDIVKDYSELQVKEETAGEARDLYEKNIQEVEQSLADQDTSEIPALDLPQGR